MQRLPLILATFALFAAACSSTPIGETSDTLPGTSATESTTSSSIPALDGPVAPDFVLPLEPSGSFVLSQEVKPVYMVFWAEW